MSKIQVNFNLGSRGLTAEESVVVENAKDLFRSGLEHHGKSIAGHVVFASKSKAVATSKPSVKPQFETTGKSPASGSAAWTSSRTTATTQKIDQCYDRMPRCAASMPGYVDYVVINLTFQRTVPV